MINLYERRLLDPAGIEPMTWSPVRHASNWATEAHSMFTAQVLLFSTKVLIYVLQKMTALSTLQICAGCSKQISLFITCFVVPNFIHQSKLELILFSLLSLWTPWHLVLCVQISADDNLNFFFSKKWASTFHANWLLRQKAITTPMRKSLDKQYRGTCICQWKLHSYLYLSMKST